MAHDHELSEERLAARELDQADQDLLQRVAELFAAVDPVPVGLVDRITFGITLDALHAEVAELQRQDAAPVGVRGQTPSDVQTVTFTSASLTTMVTITQLSADRVRIDGWVAPGAGVTVELRLVDANRQTTADEDGRFVFDDIPSGMAQFVVRSAGEESQSVVITPALEL
jgi:hypothetical protein